jgi:protein-S-isoprenylcysteine O-methyltransferase Ste14
MEVIGKIPINPFLFFSGKTAGYLTWAFLLLDLLGFPLLTSRPVALARHLSYAMLTAGLVFTIFSLVNLGRSTRLGLPTGQTELKTRKIYKISRNPMYLGFDLLTVASVLHSFNLIISPAGLYSIFIYHLIILAEEKFMEQRLEPEFIQYRKMASRYL